jgi:DNA-binding NarL/FixJ family response regulator
MGQDSRRLGISVANLTWGTHLCHFHEATQDLLDIVVALNRVRRGGRYASPDLAEKLVLELGQDVNTPLHDTLSDREFQVMRLIASGKGITEPAEVLALSDKTVSTCKTRVFQKLKLASNAELVRYVIENTLLQ